MRRSAPSTTASREDRRWPGILIFHPVGPRGHRSYYRLGTGEILENFRRETYPRSFRAFRPRARRRSRLISKPAVLLSRRDYSEVAERSITRAESKTRYFFEKSSAHGGDLVRRKIAREEKRLIRFSNVYERGKYLSFPRP